MSKLNFVLIHSPLVGNYTWQPVATLLREQGHTAIVPDLQDQPDDQRPYWQQEVENLEIIVDEPIIIGHSAAGALLPAIGQKLNAQALVFVDAVLLFEPLTRLELLHREDKEFGTNFEKHLKSGGKFPEWTVEQLQSLIPDDEICQQLVADLRPRGLDFFTEKIEIPPNWEQTRTGYIQLSDSYHSYAQQARDHQWHVTQQSSHHFMMLTHPIKVTQLLTDLVKQILNV